MNSKVPFKKAWSVKMFATCRAGKGAPSTSPLPLGFEGRGRGGGRGGWRGRRGGREGERGDVPLERSEGGGRRKGEAGFEAGWR